MKTRRIVLVLLAVALLMFSVHPVLAAKPIVIGAPLSTAFLYGWAAERGITLAIEEINAAGGVNVNGEKRPLKVEVIDTRDLEPGVPVSEALLAVEKLILDRRPIFLSVARFARKPPWQPCPFCPNTRKCPSSPPAY